MAKVSIAWKVQVYGEGGALSEEQIRKLALGFAIDPELVRRLSQALAHALHPKTRPRGVREVIDRQRKGRAELAQSVAELRSALQKIEKCISRLSNLHIDDPFARPGRDPMGLIHKYLREGKNNIDTAHYFLETRAKNEAGIYLRGEPDKRRIRDNRRVMVCARIFEFWKSAGRSLSFTTDPLTSERQGRLVEFVNSVVSCVSEPPGSLDGETIRMELDGLKRLAP